MTKTYKKLIKIYLVSNFKITINMKECIECGKPIDSKDDLYCMACIKYEEMFYEQDCDDDDDYYERQAEREAEELWERACNCTCGAWQNINGQTVHVADCCCGAE